MWIVRWTVIIIVLLAILGFSLQNQEQKVQITLGGYETPEMPLYFALYISFALGILVFFLVSIYNLLQLKTEISRHKRENRRLRDELDRLRNVSIEEELPTALPPAPAEIEQAPSVRENRESGEDVKNGS